MTLAGNGTGSVTSEPSGGGINCPSDCSNDYPPSTRLYLWATPGAGSQFVGWSGEGSSGTSFCEVTMGADRSITATFSVISRSLTVTPDDNGSITCDGGACAPSYPHGTVVTLQATPDDGFIFSGWTGDCSGSGSCLLTMDTNKSVGALFGSGPQYTLTVGHTGTGGGSGVIQGPGIDCGYVTGGNDCTQSYAAGTQVTLTGVSSSYYVEWKTGACDSATDGEPCVLTMDGNKHVTFRFES